MFTGEIINLVLDEDKEKELDEALEKLSRVIDEACDKYAQEKKLNDKEEMDLSRKKEEPKEKSDDNSIEISVELKNYDEIVKKLEDLNRLENSQIMKSVVEYETSKSSFELNADGLMTCSVENKENHTLDELKQKLIDDLYNRKSYEANDIELIKILFEK